MTMYQVVNVAHGRHNRGARSALPANPRMKQHIGAAQQRVLPERPVFLTEQQLQECLPELREKVAAHIFEVRTLDGRVLDLSTMKAAEVKPIPPARLRKATSKRVAGVRRRGVGAP